MLTCVHFQEVIERLLLIAVLLELNLVNEQADGQPLKNHDLSHGRTYIESQELAGFLGSADTNLRDSGFSTSLLKQFSGEFKGLLQHSSVWLLHFLISNGFSYTIATTFFTLQQLPQLLTVTTIFTTTRSLLITSLLKGQPLDLSNQCQTVN